MLMCMCVWYWVPVNNTSVCKYWKILFYPSNTDTGTFYRDSTDIDTDVQYPKFDTDILIYWYFQYFPVSLFSCCKAFLDIFYLRSHALIIS